MRKLPPPDNLTFSAHLWRNDITGLRALAVLPVLFFHAFPDWIPGGFFGVDIFFVISGYLISGIIFRGLSAENFSWISFYDKRIRRILPNLFLLLVTVLFSGWYLMWPIDFGLLSKHAFASGFFYENFQLLRETGYFNVQSHFKPLMHLWSLAIEEQFYIVFPIVCLLLWRTGQRIQIVGSFVVLFFLISLGCFLFAPDRVWAFFFPVSRFWELGAGILLSYGQTFYPRQDQRSIRTRNLLSLTGFGVLVFLFFLPKASHLHPGSITLLAVAGTVFLIAAQPDAIINRTLLSWRPMTFIGLISYSLYLWHWPLLSFLFITTPEHTTFDKLSLLFVAFVLATLVYFFVENPIRRCKAPPVILPKITVLLTSGFHSRQLIQDFIKQPSLWLLSAVFLLNCGSAYIRLHPGLLPTPYSLPDDYYFAKDSKYYDAKVFHPLTTKDGEYFVRVVNDTRPQLIVTGDSHMEMYLRRHVKLARETGINFENLTISSCFIFGETHSKHEGDECRDNQKRFSQLLQNGHIITNIAIAEKWGDYHRRYPQLFESSLKRFATYLDKNPQIKVWVILDPPWEELEDNSVGEGAYDPRKHVSRFNMPKDLLFRYPYDTRWSDGNKAVRRILGDRVQYIETEPYICHNGRCNLKYYLNDDHLQTDFTEEKAVWIDTIYHTIMKQQPH